MLFFEPPITAAPYDGVRNSAPFVVGAGIRLILQSFKQKGGAVRSNAAEKIAFRLFSAASLPAGGIAVFSKRRCLQRNILCCLNFATLELRPAFRRWTASGWHPVADIFYFSIFYAWLAASTRKKFCPKIFAISSSLNPRTTSPTVNSGQLIHAILPCWDSPGLISLLG